MYRYRVIAPNGRIELVDVIANARKVAMKFLKDETNPYATADIQLYNREVDGIIYAGWPYEQVYKTWRWVNGKRKSCFAKTEDYNYRGNKNGKTYYLTAKGTVIRNTKK